MQSHIAFRKAVIFALLLSIPALFLFCTAIVGLFSVELIKHFYIQILIGFIAMYLFCEFVGLRISTYLQNYLFGGLFGVAVFLLGSTAGSISSLFVYWDFSFDYIWKPLFALSTFGTVPAFIIGLIFTQFFRRTSRHRNAAEQDAAANP
jgi:hypothetical protein